MDHKKIIFLLTFIVIVISEDTLMFGTNISSMFVSARFIVYLILLLFCFNSTWRHVDKHSLIATLSIVASFSFVMLINDDFRNGYFLQLLGILLAFKIANTIKFNEFMVCFIKVIYFLSLASIGLFLLVSVVPPIINMLPTMTNYGDVKFATILVSNIMKLDGLLRNSSIFREPGVFGIYLMIGLLYEFFYIPKLNVKRVITFLIALVTTFSTTAFFAFALVILAYIFQGNNFKAKKYLAIGTILFIIFILPIFSDTVFSKLDANTSEYRSTLSRVASLIIPLAMFQDHLLGVGLSNFINLYSSYSYHLFGIEFKPEGEATNTFINTFAIYGIIHGSILVYAVWRLAQQYHKSMLITLVIFLIFLLLFSSQELRFSILFNLLIMYGLIYKKADTETYEVTLEPIQTT